VTERKNQTFKTAFKNEGLYAGATFKAANFAGDKKANEIFYGKPVSMQDILYGKAVAMPEEAREFVTYLEKY
jgi:lipid-binding SYLF domain-containing protein